ncbi:MAG: MmcQ/YjbR family DNA-binding protein [Alistipes sp.]|nr:MmcQ/YjbR family DNA-binding protein [Alistipes sp.]
MSIEEIRDYALSLPNTEECRPFDDDTLVYKIGGKWFAVVDLIDNDKVVVKCDPDVAIELRDLHEEVTEAWHFNKRHWNAIRLNGDIGNSFIFRQVYNSYMLVIEKSVTPKTLRVELLDAALRHTVKP